jgi:uncharacterized membrane protein
VILGCIAAFLFATDQFQSPGDLNPNLRVPGAVRPRHRDILVCYFRALKLGDAAQVAPIDSSAWC